MVAAKARLAADVRAAIAGIGEQQRGLITRAQLREAGLSDASISRWARAGLLSRVHRGVYALGHPHLPRFGPELAGLLAIGRGSALGCRSAAWVWQMTREAPREVELVLPEGTARSRPGLRVRTTSRLSPADVTTHHGLRVTKPARTLIDLAAVLPSRDHARLLEDARARRLVSDTALREALERAGNVRGTAVIRGVLEAESHPALLRSEAEARLLGLLREAGLPEPRVNASLLRYEVDFLWPERRLVVEIDGYEFHHTRRAFERDRRKRARLAAAGHIVMAFTWWRLTQEPLAVVAEVASALSGAPAGTPGR